MACSRDSDRIGICFDGWVLNKTYASLMVEMLKHILYARGQIPCLFDQAKRLFVSSSELVPKTLLQRKQKSIHSSLSLFDSLFQNLTTSITDLEVNQVVFSLGPTLVSPKEVYVVDLPPSLKCGECKGKSLNQLVCVRYFFRNLMSSGILNRPDSPSLTNMTVMIEIPRNSNLKNFMKMRNYKIPNRGKKLTICVHHKNCDHLPFVPFCDSDSCDSDTSNHFMSLARDMERVTINSNPNEQLDQYCWIQILPTIKGFKDLVTTQNSMDNWI
ncbi:MAD2L1-binding protein-like [Centruroides sculpturatus]|uniref:MAD2L1-binding protein-like n=1 Tax=Centruroides sculpturatus TaxID=218467 RepID=UPI000C6ED9F2|nr:MAD2L1-binding protein-like [Centruroides sculpturatus]